MDGSLKFKEPLNTGLHPCRCHPSWLYINKSRVSGAAIKCRGLFLF